jgi:hypothetical protein
MLKYAVVPCFNVPFLLFTEEIHKIYRKASLSIDMLSWELPDTKQNGSAIKLGFKNSFYIELMLYDARRQFSNRSGAFAIVTDVCILTVL